MSSSYVDSFTYGAEKIGGTSGNTHDTEVLDSYMFVTNEDEAEFVCRFAVRVTPSGNSVTDWTALATACQAVEAALRMRYQKLTVDWSTANQETFDPDVNASTFPSTGFSAEPNLRKLGPGEFPQSGEARGYEFRVKIGQPPNYTDAFGAAAGRRQVDVSMHYDVNDRLVVTLSGTWTQVPTKLARAQFLAAIDGVSGYAAYRLSKINSTVSGQSADTWTPVRKDESDPNDLSLLTFTREYAQHVNGRRISSVEIFYGPQRLRTVTIRGTYLRTIDGTGGTYGNVYGTAATATANFLTATTGGYDFAVTTLAALVTAQGGPLTVGTNCELVTEPFITNNEQNDRTDYSFVFQELIQKQSTAASFLDDPNIVGDSIVVGVSYNELEDSPKPLPASSVPGPGGSGQAPGGSAGVNPASAASGGSTVSPPPAQLEKVTGGTNPGSVSSSDVVPSKPIDFFAQYEAYFNKDNVLDPFTYWKANVLPLLREVIEQEFGLGQGSELIALQEQTDRTKNRVTANLHVRLYAADVVNFIYTQGITNDLGIRADPAFTGTAHDYLVQQGLPRTTMTRTFEAIYKTGGSFSLDPFVTPQALSGWVPLVNATPRTRNVVKGIPGQGVATQALTYATLEEVLLWVRSNVASGGGTTPGGPSPTITGQNASPAPVTAATATGSG